MRSLAESGAAERLDNGASRHRDGDALAELASAVAEAAGPDEDVAVRVGDREVILAPPARRLLAKAASRLAKGPPVAVLSPDEEVTTQVAADVLGVSRPYLVKLLHDGEIPYRRVGNRHRIQASDLLAYKASRDHQRARDLSRLTRLTEDLDPQF